MNLKKYAGIILNILVPLLTVYLVCVWDRGSDRESGGALF